MASIKDIAKACGVSVATVSKALNGHNDISQATKEKVREAARQIGYMPNSAARALKTNRTCTFASLDKGVNVGASKRKLGSRVKLTAFSG